MVNEKEKELDFEAILNRILEGTGAKSQAEIATILEVRRGTISDAKRRNSIPSDWILKLCRSHNLNPVWLLDGVGAKFIPQTKNSDNKAMNKDLTGTYLPSEHLNNLLEYVKYLVFFIETIEKKCGLELNPYSKGIILAYAVECFFIGAGVQTSLATIMSVMEVQFAGNPKAAKEIRTLKKKVQLKSLQEILRIGRNGDIYDEKDVFL